MIFSVATHPIMTVERRKAAISRMVSAPDGMLSSAMGFRGMIADGNMATHYLASGKLRRQV